MINLTMSPNYGEYSHSSSLLHLPTLLLGLVKVDHWYNRTLTTPPFIPGSSTIWVSQLVESGNNNNSLYYNDEAKEYKWKVNASDGVYTIYNVTMIIR